MQFTSILMDVSPLHDSPAFRRLWMGAGMSGIGSHLTVFAVTLQVYTLTGSSLAVGAIGLFVALPSILLGLLGGAIADAFDRRKLMLVTTTGMTAVSVGFVVQAFTKSDRLWLLYLLVALQSLLGSVGVPARRTLMPRLLSKEQIAAGVALSLFSSNLSRIVGPALGGVVAGIWGLKACYLIDALSFTAALYGIARLPAVPPEGNVARPGPRAIGEALRFIRDSRILKGAFLVDLGITVLGIPFALFPAINEASFGGTPQTLGLLTAAPAIGGFIGTAFSGPVGHVSHQGRATIIACIAWGAAVAGFGLTTKLWLALALLVVAGAVDVLSVTFSQTIVQVITPDALRGRVAAAEHIVSMGGPHIGNFRAGAVGAFTSPSFSAVSGGIASIVGAVVVAIGVPTFLRYQAGQVADRGAESKAP